MRCAVGECLTGLGSMPLGFAGKTGKFDVYGAIFDVERAAKKVAALSCNAFLRLQGFFFGGTGVG
jgi:hypothetical protein